jgi:hypothetical protein
VCNPCSIKDTVFELPLSDAVTVAVSFIITDAAVIEKVAVVAPGATVTDPGTLKAVLLSETDTAAPAEGAAPDTVTVQADVPPDDTVVGVHCSAETVIGAGVTVRDAVLELLLSDAVTPTD